MQDELLWSVRTFLTLFVIQVPLQKTNSHCKYTGMFEDTSTYTQAFILKVKNRKFFFAHLDEYKLLFDRGIRPVFLNVTLLRQKSNSLSFESFFHNAFLVFFTTKKFLQINQSFPDHFGLFNFVMTSNI